jgi:hypothetical protein
MNVTGLQMRPMATRWVSLVVVFVASGARGCLRNSLWSLFVRWATSEEVVEEPIKSARGAEPNATLHYEEKRLHQIMRITGLVFGTGLMVARGGSWWLVTWKGGRVDVDRVDKGRRR